MAHPFLPITTELIKKLTRVNREPISTVEFCEQWFVLSIPKTRPTEESNQQNKKTNQPHHRTNNRL